MGEAEEEGGVREEEEETRLRLRLQELTSLLPSSRLARIRLRSKHYTIHAAHHTKTDLF